MTDLVVVSLEPWDSVWRRNQHLVAGLLRQDPNLRVLFVEPDVDVLHSAGRTRRVRTGRGLRPGPTLDGVGAGSLWLFEPTKLLPRRVNPRHDAHWAHAVARAARRLGMTAPLLWVNDPRGAELLSLTGWPALYDITDDWTLADRRPVDLARTRHHEEQLLSTCGEVVVCSPALQASKGARRRVTLIPNGVDTAAYQKDWPRPTDLPDGRVALYVGTLHRDRLEVELSVATARGLPAGASLVFVGPNALDHTDTATLRAAGVILLGARPSEAIPAYLCSADVLIVPHVMTAFTESLDPIKAYEYAAAARPVVATPVAGFHDTRTQLVTIAETNHFASAVARAMTHPPDAAGTPPAWMANLDWSVRVVAMRGVLDHLLSDADAPTPPAAPAPAGRRTPRRRPTGTVGRRARS